MNRRRLLVSAAAVLVAGPAFAQDYAGSVVAQLRRQGFDAITREVTLLGRVRIIASRGDGRREIIINPKTGEILRDLWMSKGGGPLLSEIAGDDDDKDDDNGRDDDRDDDDDDRDDDDDDRDDDDDDRDDDDDDRDNDDDDRDDDDNSGSGKDD
jgi:hypothetical protein